MGVILTISRECTSKPCSPQRQLRWTFSTTNVSLYRLSVSIPYIFATDSCRRGCSGVCERYYDVRYRYVSPDGTRFKYTSVLLILQCSINFLIATIGFCVLERSQVGNVCFGAKTKPFSTQTPKKDLVGRCVAIQNRGKE